MKHKKKEEESKNHEFNDQGERLLVLSDRGKNLENYKDIHIDVKFDNRTESKTSFFDTKCPVKDENSVNYSFLDIYKKKNKFMLDAKYCTLSINITEMLNKFDDFFLNFENFSKFKKTNSMDELKKDFTIDNLVSTDFNGFLTRKTFKQRVENNYFKNNFYILETFKGFVLQLKKIDDTLTSLNNKSIFFNEILKTKKKNDNFLNNFKKLKDQYEHIQLKKSILISFKSTFSLDEIEKIKLTQGSFDDDFFRIFEKLSIINEKCKLLLSFENDKLGLSFLYVSNDLLKKSTNKIIDYIEFNIDSFYSLCSESIVIGFQRFLYYYQKNKVLYDFLINIIVKFRSIKLLEKFMINLEGHISMNDLNQNVLQSEVLCLKNDSLKLVNHLFNFFHSLFLNEIELNNKLFVFKYEKKNEYVNLNYLILEKVFNPLFLFVKTKIDLILSIESKIKKIYEIYILITKYKSKFINDLSKDIGIINLMSLMSESSKKILLKKIKDEQILVINARKSQITKQNILYPPEWLHFFYNSVLPIFENVISDDFFDTDVEIDKFKHLIVDKPIDIFEKTIIENEFLLDEKNKTISKFNFYFYMKSKILLIEVFKDQIYKFDTPLFNLKNLLIKLTFDFMLDECNLKEFYDLLQSICFFNEDKFDISNYQSLITNQLYSKKMIKQVNESIKSFISNSINELHEYLSDIIDKISINQIVEISIKKFMKFYQHTDDIFKKFFDQKLVLTQMEVKSLLKICHK